jgi:4-hydroxyphenylpyruvate dioxygenase
MAASEALGIKRVHSLHFASMNSERSRRYYTEKMGWNLMAVSGPDLEEQTGQTSMVFGSGDIRWVVSTPLDDSCRAARFLKRHPAGVMSIAFEVEDIEQTWAFLESRGGTPIHQIQTTTNCQAGYFKHFSITTPLGDLTFRFIETSGWTGFAPGFIGPQMALPATETSYQFKKIDHITCNAITMAPVLLWFEHVLGMEECWGIAFHTHDIEGVRGPGSGLKSVVMWDPASGIKFPINEPMEPFFKEGQINQFVEDNHGAGVQHLAFEVDNIIRATGTLKKRGVSFLETPDVYYAPAARRLRDVGVDVAEIKHDLEELKRFGLLIDGSPDNRYMLQVFFKDAATCHDDEGAGPFFFEIIERQGDEGFGGGNFRALFEAIELHQQPGVAS